MADALPVALDAMGGDRAPDAIVSGAIRACADGLGPITLVGIPDRIQPLLDRQGGGDLPISVAAATEIIGMAEHPGRAARAKRNSSMHVGFELVRRGEAAAFISAGNSGAMMAVGILVLRRVARCDRPAIAAAIPSAADPIVLLDMGANVECRASHLVQFALMGAAYATACLQRPRPSVGLLSNGVEPTKGTETLREAHRLLTQTDLRYVGYVEGNMVPGGGVDVVVTDGFVGNVVLKLSEGIALALLTRVKASLKGDLLGSLGAALMKRTLRRLQRELDWANVGAAPLLGLEGLALVAHGGSGPAAIAAAVARAREYAAIDLVGQVRASLEVEAAPDQRTITAELPLARGGD